MQKGTKRKKEVKIKELTMDGDIELLPANTSISGGDVYEVYNNLVCSRPRVNRIVTLWLTGCYSAAEIGDIVGLSKETTMKWLRREDVRNYIIAYQGDEMALLKTKMVGNADKAFNKMVKLINSNIDNVALQASKDILDRTGFKPVTEVKQEINIKTYEEQLHDIMNNVMDVEYEEVDDDGVE